MKVVEAIEKYSCFYNYKIQADCRKKCVEKVWVEIRNEVNDESKFCWVILFTKVITQYLN